LHNSAYAKVVYSNGLSDSTLLGVCEQYKAVHMSETVHLLNQARFTINGEY